MKKSKRKTLVYSEENLERVSILIKKNLTGDLIPKKWRNLTLTNNMFGHCHTASSCLYLLFGSDNLSLHRGLDNENVWHWWVQDNTGKIIDLTSDQYYSKNKTPPYDKAEKVGMLGFEYKKRALSLLKRVKKELPEFEDEQEKDIFDFVT